MQGQKWHHTKTALKAAKSRYTLAFLFNKWAFLKVDIEMHSKL